MRLQQEVEDQEGRKVVPPSWSSAVTRRVLQKGASLAREDDTSGDSPVVTWLAPWPLVQAPGSQQMEVWQAPGSGQALGGPSPTQEGPSFIQEDPLLSQEGPSQMPPYTLAKSTAWQSRSVDFSLLQEEDWVLQDVEGL